MKWRRYWVIVDNHMQDHWYLYCLVMCLTLVVS